MESEFNRELFDTKWKIQLNACHLADVRDAIEACNREWDALQEERQGLLARVVELEQVEE